jgi:ADP-ribose pyrophosphatase
MARQTVHRGRKIEVQLDVSTGPNGEEIRRDVIMHPGAVVILPVLDAENICLLKNYRFAVEETLWEVPAGTLEPNEVLQKCAERELAEETGYTSSKWTSLGYMYASPGVLNEKLHLFVAEDCQAGIARPEIDEQLEPVTVPFAKALQMIDDGTIKDAKTVTLLLLWNRLRQTP